MAAADQLRNRAAARATSISALDARAQRAADGGFDSAFTSISITNTRQLLSTLHHRCALTIAHKLHGYILSAASGVPTVALAYRAKAFDVALSGGARSLASRGAHNRSLAGVAASAGAALPSAVLVSMASLRKTGTTALDAAVLDLASASVTVESGAANAAASSEAAAAWWIQQAAAMITQMAS